MLCPAGYHQFDAPRGFISRQVSMIEVDDSKLTADHLDYLERWAKVLGVSVPELLGRILWAGIEGEVYCEQSPPE